MYLKDLEDENGKIQPRLVDVDSGFAKLCFQNLHLIDEGDYEAVKVLVDNPESYDFNKILKEK